MDRPRSLPEFQRTFADEAACLAYLYSRRFPNGFACPVCGDTKEPYRITTRQNILKCRSHLHETSLTANTVMHRTKQPISLWFWAAWLATSHTPGMSAVQLQKLLGLSRYETAFQMLHKLRAAMVRPERDAIGGQWPTEVDEKFVGGATQGKGKGLTDKVLVAGAVEVRPRPGKPAPKDKSRKPPPPRHRGGHGRSFVAGRLRLQCIPNRKQETLEPFVTNNVLPGTLVRTDGWTGYDWLRELGFQHEPVAIAGDHSKTDKHLPMIHIVFGNLDAWLLGTHHGVSPKHLQAYLNEFTFRFNRRFWPMAAFDAVLGVGVQVRGPTYAGLYRGTWKHPGAAAPPTKPL
jgi:transposase-like protein